MTKRKSLKEDENNFKYKMHQFYVQMSGGILHIDDSEYEELDDDPSYTFAREVWRLRNGIS